METLSYLLKVNICWASFYACYWLLFRKQTFFAWNRIYLLGSLLTGMLIPGIKFHQKVTLFVENQLSAPTYNVIPAHANIENQHSIWEAAIVISYLTGVLIMLAFFVKSLIQIYRIIKKGSVVERNDCRLIVYPGQAGSGSFSFLKWTVMPDQDFENHFNTIFSHEIVHIRQWH